MRTGVFPVRKVGDLQMIPSDVRSRILSITLQLRCGQVRTVEHPGFCSETRCLRVPKDSIASSTKVAYVVTDTFWSCPRCHRINQLDVVQCECPGRTPQMRPIEAVPASPAP